MLLNKSGGRTSIKDTLYRADGESPRRPRRRAPTRLALQDFSLAASDCRDGPPSATVRSRIRLFDRPSVRSSLRPSARLSRTVRPWRSVGHFDAGNPAATLHRSRCRGNQSRPAGGLGCLDKLASGRARPLEAGRVGRGRDRGLCRF